MAVEQNDGRQTEVPVTFVWLSRCTDEAFGCCKANVGHHQGKKPEGKVAAGKHDIDIVKYGFTISKHDIDNVKINMGLQ